MRATVIDGLVVTSRVFKISRAGLITSRLATMDCVALAAKLVANRPDTVTPKQGDLPQPLPLFYAQALKHRCEMMRDIASFI